MFARAICHAATCGIVLLTITGVRASDVQPPARQPVLDETREEMHEAIETPADASPGRQSHVVDPSVTATFSILAVDMLGRTAVHNPTAAAKSSRYWAAMTGRHYCCQGNTLTGREVIVAMAKAYEETEGSLADRLMAALVAGDRAGGDHRGRLAAGIRVAKRGVDGYWLDLHVDRSDDAVTDVARKYAGHPHEAKDE